MPRQQKFSAASAMALDTSREPAAGLAGLRLPPPNPEANGASLARLNAAIAELKALAAEPLIRRAVTAINAGKIADGMRWLIQALETDEKNGLAWYVLAFARERAGDLAGSLQCYEKAVALLPDSPQIPNDLARLAMRMGMYVQAEKLYLHFIRRDPENPEAYNNLVSVLRHQGRFEEAIDILKAIIAEHPTNAMLWNSLGTVMTDMGDPAKAMIFYNEALTLQPDFPKARYNRGATRLAMGDAEGALVDCEAALAGELAEDDRLMMTLAKSTMLLDLGRIEEGWAAYESRLSHQYDDATIFAIDRPKWAPGDDLGGKHLLVVAEQGLGDEVLFANLLADVDEALGPDGRLALSVEKRLVPLFQRSFPQANVGHHVTVTYEARTVRIVPHVDAEMQSIDLWAPMGSLLRQFRPSVDSFPQRDRYLTADPERIAHWRQVLSAAPSGRKVGLLWKSAIKAQGRDRYFSPFEAWAPVLQTPGVTFVNLQYGDCAEELEQAKRDFGVEIWTPPGIDLKNDLDDLAALSCAMDLVLGFSNATFNIAAACGAPVWLVSTKGVWPRLGTRRYPWYPQARVFISETDGDWAPVMGDIAAALGPFANDGTGALPKG